MADLVQTPANVKINAVGTVSVEQGGEALTQGQPVYLLAGKYHKCDANDTEEKAVCAGIVLTPCAINGFFLMARPGCRIDLGATLTVSETYILSTTAGAIAPIGDLASESYLTILGFAKTAGSLTFRPHVSGVQKP